MSFPLNFALFLTLFSPYYSFPPRPCTLCSKDSTYVSIGIDVCVKVKKKSAWSKDSLWKVLSNCYVSIIEKKIRFWCERDLIDLILAISLYLTQFAKLLCHVWCLHFRDTNFFCILAFPIICILMFLMLFEYNYMGSYRTHVTVWKLIFTT